MEDELFLLTECEILIDSFLVLWVAKREGQIMGEKILMADPTFSLQLLKLFIYFVN